MIPPDTLTAKVICPHCPWPVRIEVPVEFVNCGATVDVSVDCSALRLAVTAHAKQHQANE